MIQIGRTGNEMTIQDIGRFGYRRYGVPSSGYLDRQSAMLANMLVNNPLTHPVLEMYLSGHEIKFHAECFKACAVLTQLSLVNQPLHPIHD